jgi:dihydropyrimidinase
MLDLAIRHGRVVTADGIQPRDIGVAEGVIVELGSAGSAAQEVDATGRFVLPGVVDVHTHLDGVRGGPDGPRSADDYYSGTVAAACGGVTTIVDYARQFPGWTLRDTLAYWSGQAESRAVVDYAFHLVLGDFGQATLDEIPALVEAGFPTFKIFMSRVSDDEMLRTLRAIGHAGGLPTIHCENAALNADAQACLAADGHSSARYWALARPRASEVEAVARAIEYAAYTETAVYLVHLASREAVDHVRAGKARGVRIVAETRPCYLLLTDDRYADPAPDYLGFTGYPPLRSAADVDALWRALADGTLDTVASDHSAWSLEQKSDGADDFRRLLVGLPSLETQLCGLYSMGVRGGRLDLPRLVEVLSTEPARAMGLYPRKGSIAVGSDADLVLFDANRRATIRYADLHSRCGYEPLEGFDCTGWPVLTIARGEIVAHEGAFVGAPGRGQLLYRARYDGGMNQSGSAT